MECHLEPAAEDEPTVYGACRPGYPRSTVSTATVTEWIQRIEANRIERVCCLLGDAQLAYYRDLLGQYRSAFGDERVVHAPIKDHTMMSADLYRDRVAPFLRAADTAGEPVVVHCSAGIGRTSRVLVLWLALERGYSLDAAIEEVAGGRRNPTEGVSKDELRAIYERLR